MWRVQTEGYSEGKGMLVGTVSYDLSDAPDGEFISGGQNSKGPDSMAIGRQGSFLHWGFAASPTFMTDEAKLVFVNSICYIHKFKGQRAFVKKESVSTRDSIDFTLYQLTAKGAAAWEAHTAKGIVEHQKMTEELMVRREKGEKLTEMEEARLKWAAPSWSQSGALEALPEDLRDLLGDDIAGYRKYYEENRPWLYSDPAERYGALTVDEDARSIGIANNDLRLLDHCIDLLQKNPEDEKALRLLTRYTGQSFDSANQWREWLEQRRGFLFFSDHSGFKFLVDVNKAVAAGRKDLVEPASAGEELPAIIEAMKIDEPDRSNPVTYSCSIVRSPVDAGWDYRLVVKFRILKGWHLYSFVPSGVPYTATQLKVEADDAIELDEKWSLSAAKPLRENPKIAVWEDECVFTRQIRFAERVVAQADKKTGRSAAGYSLKLNIDFQTCNEVMCMPPESRSEVLALPR